MSLNTKLLNISSKLINKFGTSIVWTPNIEGSYDVSTSSLSNTTGTPVTLNCIIEEYAESLRFLGDKLSPGSQIIEGDKKVTIAALDVSSAPLVGDTINAFSIDYKVLGIASQTGTTGIALYVLHIRRK